MKTIFINIWMFTILASSLFLPKIMLADYDEAVFWPNQTLSTLDGEFQYFDAAWPKTNDATKTFPLIIWLHGSGWFAPVPKSTFGQPDMEALAKKDLL